MTIRYRSTRGKQNGLRFEEVVLGGLATDRGLYVPETIPTMSMADIEKVFNSLRWIFAFFIFILFSVVATS
jgi:threonine synthase